MCVIIIIKKKKGPIFHFLRCPSLSKKKKIQNFGIPGLIFPTENDVENKEKLFEKNCLLNVNNNAPVKFRTSEIFFFFGFFLLL